MNRSAGGPCTSEPRNPGRPSLGPALTPTVNSKDRSLLLDRLVITAAAFLQTEVHAGRRFLQDDPKRHFAFHAFLKSGPGDVVFLLKGCVEFKPFKCRVGPGCSRCCAQSDPLKTF